MEAGLFWRAGLAALLIFGCSSAHAAVVLQASGTITSVSASQAGVSVSVPTGTIQVGDTYSLKATFDPASALVSSLFDADPTINLYSLPGTIVSLRLGSYSSIFSPTFDFNSSAQLWNDRQIVGSVDSQSFRFFNFDVSDEGLPFSIGGGLIAEDIILNSFDFSATARSDDLISSLAPLSSFGSKSFNYILFNNDTQLFVNLSGVVNTASLENVPAVPEPATWALMLLGFGFVGSAIRSIKRRPNLTIIYV